MTVTSERDDDRLSQVCPLRDGAPCAVSLAVDAVSRLPADAELLCGISDRTIRAGSRPAVYVYGRCAGRGDPVGTIGPAETLIDGPPPTTGASSSPTSYGRYALEDELARGGMGVVYQARDTELERPVALKVLLAGHFASASRVSRFLREARAAAALEDPGVVRVLDLGRTEQGLAWYAMELIDGPTLAHVLAGRGALAPEEATRIVEIVARTLHRVHQAGIAHRDVKPGNILMTPAGAPLLSDFGLARDVAGQGTQLTRSGQLLGTPAYMAPEQLAGKVLDWIRVDVYALGTVLRELLTGTRAVGATGAPSSSGDGAPLPRDLQTICAVATAPDPAARYASAAELADDLARFHDDRPIRAQPPGPLQRARLFVRRNRVALRAAAWTLVGVATLVATVSVFRAAGDARAARRAEDDAAARLAFMERRLGDLRAQGRDDDAEELFAGFVEAPENAGTRALALAWIDRGSRMREADRPTEAVSAYGRGYAEAQDRPLQFTALSSLAQALFEERRFDALQAVLAVVDADLGGRELPQRRRYERALALDRLDFARAQAVTGDDPELAGRLGQLAGATLLRELSDEVSSAGDLDGDGVDELLWSDPPGRGTGEGFRPLEGPRWGDRGAVFDRRGTQLRIWVQGASGARIGLLDPDGSERWFPFPDTPIEPYAVAAVGDRVFVASGQYTRRLWELQLADGRWRAAHPPTDALGSYMVAAVASDLDGDGSEELVVGMGPPLGYEVRVFDARETLALRARRPLGFVRALTTLRAADGTRLVAAGTSVEHPSRHVFPDDDHVGAPPGAHLLALQGDQLRVVGRLPSPVVEGRRDARCKALYTADLDADGLDDLVAHHFYFDPAGGEHTVTGLYWQRPDGGFDSVLLGGVYPRAVAQLDDDPADELLVHRGSMLGETWALGLGEAPFPAEAPAPLDEPLHVARRAARLHQIGLLEEAAAAYTSFADRQSDPALRADALRAAGQAWAECGRPGRAADAFEAAAAAVEDDEADLIAAMDHRLADVDHTSARGLAHELVERSPRAAATGVDARAIADWLDVALDPSAWAALPLNRAGAVGWIVPRPSRVRAVPGLSRLEIDALSGDGELLRLPLVPGRGPVGLRLSMRVERLEWGSGLTIVLGPVDPPAGEPARLSIRGRGGSGFLFRELTWDGRAYRGVREEVSAADVPFELALEVLAEPDGRTASYRLSRDGEQVLARRVPFDGNAAGAWCLAVSAIPPEEASPWVHADVTAIELLGLHPLGEPEVEVAAADDDGGLLALRRRPAATMARLADAEGPATALSRFATSWRSAWEAHPRDPAVLDALVGALALLDGPWPDRDPQALRLLVQRGRARWARGETAGAFDDLGRAAEIARAASAPEVREHCRAAEALLAEIALAQRRDADARAHAAASIACAASPRDGRLGLGRAAPLRENAGAPGWEALVEVVPADVYEGGPDLTAPPDETAANRRR